MATVWCNCGYAVGRDLKYLKAPSSSLFERPAHYSIIAFSRGVKQSQGRILQSRFRRTRIRTIWELTLPGLLKDSKPGSERPGLREPGSGSLRSLFQVSKDVFLSLAPTEVKQEVRNSPMTQTLGVQIRFFENRKVSEIRQKARPNTGKRIISCRLKLRCSKRSV